jgi:hypothetical protein
MNGETDAKVGFANADLRPVIEESQVKERNGTYEREFITEGSEIKQKSDRKLFSKETNNNLNSLNDSS